MNPLWVARREDAGPAYSERIVIAKDERPLTFAEVIAGWRQNAEFRAFALATLAAAPWPAFFWEMPPIRREGTNTPYECMLIRSDALARMAPDTDAFESQFEKADSDVSIFPNLGGDAVLVAPKIIGPPQNFAHLAAFVRSAPQAQQQALVRALGDAIDDVLKKYDGRIWISTSGLGVAWLHVRLDTYPKYYQHRPYARM